jgi:hypothetical protein
LTLYRKGESIGAIRDYFISKEPQFSKSSRCYEQIRSKLYRILRKTLKMIIKYIAVREDENFPELVPMN